MWIEKEISEWIKENYKILGYEKIIQENKNNFPDFIMLRNGERIRVEVEIYASFF